MAVGRWNLRSGKRWPCPRGVVNVSKLLAHIRIMGNSVEHRDSIQCTGQGWAGGAQIEWVWNPLPHGPPPMASVSQRSETSATEMDSAPTPSRSVDYRFEQATTQYPGADPTIQGRGTLVFPMKEAMF
jgi:hypothetical protein